MYHKANLNRIMADYTSQPLSKIEEDTDRDRYMSPLEAKEYGLIDHIIGGEEAVFNVKGSLKKFPKVRCGPCGGAPHAEDGRRRRLKGWVIVYRAARQPCHALASFHEGLLRL